MTGAPTTTDDCTDEGIANATGSFTTDINGLTENTTYYVRAYATNTQGTSYGNEVSFTTQSSCVPIAVDDVTCDNIDDDCDGSFDEDYIIDASCGAGACQSNNTPSSCVGGVETACVPGAPDEATDVTCDGIDGDCDGSVDEDYALDASCGVGACQSNNTPSSCVGGVETACVPGAPDEATDVTCDGIDGDCDGSVDEDYAVDASCGMGACQSNNTPSSCVGGVETACAPGAPDEATDVTCDGTPHDFNASRT